MDTYSLLELNEYIRRVVALNFEEPVWISCEISQASRSRGHYYLELVQKSEHSDDILAKSSAALWSSKVNLLTRKHGAVISEVLQDGVEARIQVKVEFHERYGLKFIVEDIDPTFTMGNLELRRREILEELFKKGLIEVNKQVSLAAVPQRIAVLSVDTAAGYQDFMEHLRSNAYGYHFDTHLYRVALQGQNVEAEVVAALGEVNRVASHYDCAVIIRGGGSRLDLAGFDSLKIGEAIAACSIPVLTGIGHEIDESVADVVAHTSLKTPTAVADFLIDRTAEFEGEIDGIFEGITSEIQHMVTSARTELRHAQSMLSYAPRQFIGANHTFLDGVLPRLQLATNSKIKSAKFALQSAENIMMAVKPDNVLARGFSITRSGGKVVTDPTALTSGDKVETELAKGIIKSVIE